MPPMSGDTAVQSGAILWLPRWAEGEGEAAPLLARLNSRSTQGVEDGEGYGHGVLVRRVQESNGGSCDVSGLPLKSASDSAPEGGQNLARPASSLVPGPPAHAAQWPHLAEGASPLPDLHVRLDSAMRIDVRVPGPRGPRAVHLTDAPREAVERGASPTSLTPSHARGKIADEGGQASYGACASSRTSVPPPPPSAPARPQPPSTAEALVALAIAYFLLGALAYGLLTPRALVEASLGPTWRPFVDALLALWEMGVFWARGLIPNGS
ncbi:MAG: hypothetical protein M1832_000140 [Thelocarpon impressellum]|nr:MAG: hypothetical protein M1832_000140 [Thelocarpon impressellum]